MIFFFPGSIDFWEGNKNPPTKSTEKKHDSAGSVNSWKSDSGSWRFFSKFLLLAPKKSIHFVKMSSSSFCCGILFFISGGCLFFGPNSWRPTEIISSWCFSFLPTCLKTNRASQTEWFSPSFPGTNRKCPEKTLKPPKPPAHQNEGCRLALNQTESDVKLSVRRNQTRNAAKPPQKNNRAEIQGSQTSVSDRLLERKTA